MKLVLEYDDFHCKDSHEGKNNILEEAEELLKLIPNLKITFFTAPLMFNHPLSSDKNWCKQVRSLIDQNRIQLAVHGTIHTSEEYKNLGLEEAINRIKDSEKEFEKAGLPYAKVFRGPSWGINQNTYLALTKLEYTHVYTHENYKVLAENNKTPRSIIYNWNLKDDMPSGSFDILIAHGHCPEVCGNGFASTKWRIESLEHKLNSGEITSHFVDEI